MRPPRRHHAALLLPLASLCLAASPPVPGDPPSASAGAAALHALLPDRIRQAGVLGIGTDAHHPPCESYADDNSTMVGLEPDLWAALAARLGVAARATSVDFGGLIPGVQAGRFDVALECMSDSPARESQVTFIDFAHATASAYTMAADAVRPDPASLCGLHGGVQVGTDFSASLQEFSAACVAAGKPPISIAQFGSDGAVVLALYSGRVDFVLNDRNAAKQMQAHAPRPLRVVDVGFPMMTIGVAVSRQEPALAAAVLAAMRTLFADGTYAAIMRKWGIADLSLDQPGVDLARQK